MHKPEGAPPRARFADLMTPGGHRCGEVASALQKTIRRGLERESLYWTTELYARDIALHFGH
jgi:hypothetical protein